MALSSKLAERTKDMSTGGRGGFNRGRSYVDMVFIMKQLVETYREKKGEVHIEKDCGLGKK